MNENKKIAKITSVTLEIEDHGILTLNIGLDYGGVHQSYGGYALDTFSEKEDRRIGTRYGTECILRLLRAFSATCLEEITGKYCYTNFNNSAHSAFVQSITTLEPDGSNYFSFKEIAKEIGDDK